MTLSRLVGSDDALHVHDDDLDLFVAGRLSEAESDVVRSHLAGCKACEQRGAEAVALMIQQAAQGKSRSFIGVKERRQDPRTATDDPASMRLLLPVVAEWTSVTVVDASRGGIRVRTSGHLQAGTLVQLRIKNTIVLGEVRYCVQAGDAFHAGVQIQDLH